MRSLRDEDMLSVWEQGLDRRPLDRALLILGAALPDESFESLADWPIGRRNKALAAVHGAWFGVVLQGWTTCTHCGEKLECVMDSRALAGDGLEREGNMDEPVVVSGRAFRLPTSRDLAQAARETDPRAAAIRLVERCLVGKEKADVWSDAELEEIEERIALADPLAETRLALVCPACGFAWDEALDLVAFLWMEIEAHARRLLLAVHTLATAYGWTEAEVLSLSEHRRARYLEMVQS